MLALGGRVRGVALGRTSIRRFSPHFFLLGAAFLLLETRALVSFGLLFGNTWVVNALVFFAILLSVLASIGVASVLPRRSPAPWYAALFVSLAAQLARPAVGGPGRSAVRCGTWLAAVAGVRPRVLRQPVLHVQLPGLARGRHVVRVEPPRRRVRRRDRVRRADHRLPGAGSHRRAALRRRVRGGPLAAAARRPRARHHDVIEHDLPDVPAVPSTG